MRTKTRVSLVSTVLATAATGGLVPVLGVRTATAACPCPEPVSAVLPRRGASGVPINAQVTLFADRLSQAVDQDGMKFDTDSKLRIDLRDEANNKIDGTTVRTQSPGVTTMFRFDLGDMGKLPANQKITAFAIDSMDRKYPITDFTTGAAEDTGPPSFAGITGIAASQDKWPTPNACVQQSPVNRASATAGPASDDMTAAEDLRYEFYFYKQGLPSQTTPAVVRLGATGDVELVQSTAKCGLAMFEALIPGTSYCGRVHVVDLAGRRAGVSMEVCDKLKLRTVDENGGELSSGEGGGGGCTVSPGRPAHALPAASASTLMLALLFGGRRRRRCRERQACGPDDRRGRGRRRDRKPSD